MTRWTKVLVALLALGSLPAMAADTPAQSKDRKHENEIHDRMRAREKMPKGKSVQGRADQGADAARAGGARAARTYHGVAHATRKGVNKLSKKTEKATK
jgi:hypothetical protein